MTRSQPASAFSPSLLFLVAAATVYAGGLAILHQLPRFERPQVIASAVAFDLTFTVTLLAWLFPVRRRQWPATSLIAVFAVTLAIAHQLVPPAGHRFFELVRWVTVPLEVAVLGWIGVRATRATRSRREGDPELDLLGRMQASARSILWNRAVADVLAFELAVLAYALGPRREPHVPAGALAFSYHRRIAYGSVVAALGMVVVAETFPMHVLLARWRPGVAWVASALGLYTLVYLLADWRAAKTRPVLLGGTHLLVRTGLRWTLRVPLAAIAAVDRRPPTAASKPLRAGLLGGAKIWIRLDGPVEAEGPYGRKRQVTSIALDLDDPDLFLAELAARR